jgi:hypothetical protein
LVLSSGNSPILLKILMLTSNHLFSLQ